MSIWYIEWQLAVTYADRLTIVSNRDSISINHGQKGIQN